MNESRYRVALPTCQLCSNPYDMYYHVPRVLPKCGHTFCEKCIKKQITTKKNRLSFTCMECNEDTNIKKSVENQLPKNISIIQILKSVKHKIVEQQDNLLESNCNVHHKILDLVCLTCQNRQICSHCAVFGQHKGHNISNQQQATKQDEKQLHEFMSIISDTVQQILLPSSPNNIQKSAKDRLKSTLQNLIKQNFKNYYALIQKRQQQLLQQSQSIVLDQKGGKCLDQILTSYDILKIKASQTSHLSRNQVQNIINGAKQLHDQIQKLMESYNKSVDTFLDEARKNIRDVAFFDIKHNDKRNLKKILQRQQNSPEPKEKMRKQDSVIITKKSQIKQMLEKKNTQMFNMPEKQRNKAVSFTVADDLHKNKPSTSSYSRQKLAEKQEKVNKVQKIDKPQEQNKTIAAKKVGITKPLEDSNIQKPHVKTNSINKKQRLQSPQSKPRSRSKSPVDFDAELKYAKPMKQLNYQFRSKFQSITNQIDRQPSEGTLELIGLQVTDNLIPYICEYLRTKKLKYTMIKMVKNGITDEGARILMSFLSIDPYTKVLNLTSNNLTYKSLTTVSKLIPVNNILKTVYLSNNKISPIQLKKIQQLLQHNFMQVVL